jgi:hypothetical protein
VSIDADHLKECSVRRSMALDIRIMCEVCDDQAQKTRNIGASPTVTLMKAIKAITASSTSIKSFEGRALLAEAMIHIMSVCGQYNIDIGSEIVRRLDRVRNS